MASVRHSVVLPKKVMTQRESHDQRLQWGRLWSLFGALESQDGSEWACYVLLLSQRRDEVAKTKWKPLAPEFVSFVLSSHWIVLPPPHPLSSADPIHSRVIKKMSSLQGRSAVLMVWNWDWGSGGQHPLIGKRSPAGERWAVTTLQGTGRC